MYRSPTNRKNPHGDMPWAAISTAAALLLFAYLITLWTGPFKPSHPGRSLITGAKAVTCRHCDCSCCRPVSQAVPVNSAN